MINQQHIYSTPLSTIKAVQRILISCILLLITACANHQTPVENIQITQQGQNIKNRPTMHDVCKGFHLNKSQFSHFYHNAKIVEQDELSEHYKKLPCFASGTVSLNGEHYQWIIRAGGIGEFFNETNQFTKICGIKCCDKVQGVC